MMSKSPYINLVNVIPKEIAEAVEFRILESGKDSHTVSVPYGERLQFPTNKTSVSWRVSAAVKGVSTNSCSSILPNDFYICQIKDWSQSLFNSPITSTEISLSTATQSPKAVSDQLSKLAKTGDINQYTSSGHALIEAHQENDCTQSLHTALRTLSSQPFSDIQMENTLREKLISALLANEKNTTLAQKVDILSHITPQALPLDKDDHAQWGESRSKDCSRFLNTLAELNAEISPDFDATAKPKLNTSRLSKKATQANQLATQTYNRQLLASRMHQRLTAITTRYFAFMSKTLNTNEPQSRDTPPLSQLEITPNVLPEDNFEGRDLNTFGIGERIHLSLPEEQGISPTQSNQLRWSVIEGNGHLCSNYDGTATYVNTGLAEKALIGLYDQTEGKKTKPLAKVEVETNEPTGASMQQAPETGIWHEHNTWSVGFLGEIFLTPDNVSYANVLFREGEAVGESTGWLDEDPEPVHQIGQEHTITGNQVDCFDEVSAGPRNSPYGVGTFTWPIPWQYKADEGDWTTFTTADHNEISDANGKAIIEKKGAGPFEKAAAAADSNYLVNT